MRKARSITGHHGSMLTPGRFTTAAPPGDRHHRLPVAPCEPTPARARRPATNNTPRPPMFKFEELGSLSDAALSAMFARVRVDVAEAALAGADSQLVQRIIKRLPATRARRLAARLRRPHPIRLSDVERAQTEIVRIADQLARSGQIGLPGSRERLATTA